MSSFALKQDNQEGCDINSFAEELERLFEQVFQTNELKRAVNDWADS